MNKHEISKKEGKKYILFPKYQYTKIELTNTVQQFPQKYSAAEFLVL